MPALTRLLVGVTALVGASAAATLAPAGVLAAVGATRGPAKPSTLERVVDCAHKAVVEPKSFIITCADANEALSGLHWTVWKAGTATATGTYTMNNCTPNCAAGKFLHFATKVQLAGEKRTSLGLVYTTLHWQYKVNGKLEKETFALVV